MIPSFSTAQIECLRLLWTALSAVKRSSGSCWPRPCLHKSFEQSSTNEPLLPLGTSTCGQQPSNGLLSRFNDHPTNESVVGGVDYIPEEDHLRQRRAFAHPQSTNARLTHAEYDGRGVAVERRGRLDRRKHLETCRLNVEDFSPCLGQRQRSCNMLQWTLCSVISSRRPPLPHIGNFSLNLVLRPHP